MPQPQLQPPPRLRPSPHPRRPSPTAPAPTFVHHIANPPTRQPPATPPRQRPLCRVVTLHYRAATTVRAHPTAIVAAPHHLRRAANCSNRKPPRHREPPLHLLHHEAHTKTVAPPSLHHAGITMPTAFSHTSRPTTAALGLLSEPPFSGTHGIYSNHGHSQSHHQTLIAERKSDLGERLLSHVAASCWTVNESALVNQSTLGKYLVNSGPLGYFILFLAGGSSIRTLNCLREERIVW